MKHYIFSRIISCLLCIFFFYQSLNAQTLPSNTSGLFAGSGVCALCHTATTGVFTTKSGRDISPVSLWRSTMMANSARDPIWQAKVTAEVAAHPQLQSVIEDKCTTCHMPMGRTEAIHTGLTYFSLSEGLSDTLSMDGVSCTLCHQIQMNNLGQTESFSGQFEISDIHQIYGPYLNPFSMPMFNQSGFTPVYSQHIGQSELCATCHTLFTPYVDNQGEIAGYFPEQTPYLEWKNSVFPDEGVQCQSCHMPAIEEAMKISSRPTSLSTVRNPIYEHEFVGANSFMTSLIKANKEELQVTADAVQFDSTVAKTLFMLQNRSINLSTQEEINSDTLFLEVMLENLAGHKFPTGFPSRRAWIHLLVKNQDDEPVFESGGWNEKGEINGVDKAYEPHHALIQSPDQVQIYEAIMQDVDGAVTYTLLRGAEYIKDNRIPPRGFSDQFEDYESIAIVGNAANDIDFGPALDQITYQIPVSDEDLELDVIVELRYQVLSTGFIQDLFTHQTEKVSQFQKYYEDMDQEPVLLASASKTIPINGVKVFLPVAESKPGFNHNYPNPFNTSTMLQFSLQKESPVLLEIYDLQGKKIATVLREELHPGTYETVWDGNNEIGIPVPAGIYVASLQTNQMSDQLTIQRQ